MPFSDPELRVADYFLYGVITGTSLVIIATILMWRAAKWEIEQVTHRILDELHDSERELTEQLRKYQAENQELREKLHRMQNGSVA